MNAVIIAGGFGTRMQPLTYDRPKHLLPVANRPFLEYQVDWLRRNGVTRIAFATNYHADQIEAHFGNGGRFGVQMHNALEDVPLGTGGAIRNAAETLGGGRVIAVNGDVLTDCDLRGMVEFHEERGAVATISLLPVPRPHAFGTLITEADGRVTEWREPTEAEKKAIARGEGIAGGFDNINAGVYILEREALATIMPGRMVSVERETFPNLISATQRVYGCVIDGYWLDIGSPEQYQRANFAVIEDKVLTSVPWLRVGANSLVDPSAEIGPQVSIGSNCKIGANARLERSIILDGVTVGSGAFLDGVIIDEGSEVGADSILDARAVVARKSILGRGTRIISKELKR